MKGSLSLLQGNQFEVNHMRVVVRLSLIYFSILVFSVTHTIADERVDTDENVYGSNKVSAEQLLEKAEELSDLIVIDSRIAVDREQGFIPESISLSDEETSCHSLSEIIPNKAHPTLFYCNGIKCGRSAKAVKIAVDCGYTHLYWFRGGYAEWKQKDYPVEKD